MSHYAETNIQTAEYRLFTQRPQQPSREKQLAHYERALAEMKAAGMERLAGYIKLEADYEALKRAE